MDTEKEQKKTPRSGGRLYYFRMELDGKEYGMIRGRWDELVR